MVVEARDPVDPTGRNATCSHIGREFRRRHLAALSALFVQVLKLCERAGLVKLGHVALDGTKIKANASKHKAMSYERMCKREAELQAEVDGWLQAAEAADAAGARARPVFGVDGTFECPLSGIGFVLPKISF